MALTGWLLFVRHSAQSREEEAPFIPTWNRVFSAIPTIFDELIEAVEADHAEFAPEHLLTQSARA